MTIAFLDHNLDNWHTKVFLPLVLARGHEVIVWESPWGPGGDWCQENEANLADSIESAVERSDAIIVLAPDDIHTHPELSRVALASGKPTFVDKLLAPTTAEAEAMIERAIRSNTPLTASSSLRHAVELEAFLESLSPPGERGRGEGLTEGFFSGYGAWDRYGVHTIAMALRVFGGGVKRLVNTGTQNMPNVVLEWEDGRRASLVVAHGKDGGQHSPWRFILRSGERLTSGTIADFDGFYRNQIDFVLDAFENRTSMDQQEMLDAVRILELAPKARDSWVTLA